MACIILVGNLFISPINLDGTKKARWGSYLIDIADQYYPYEDALTWIKENYPNRRILLTGLYYPYRLSFYFEKLECYPQLDIILTPPEPKLSVDELLQQALEMEYYVVIVPVIRLMTQFPQNLVNISSTKFAKIKHIPYLYIQRSANMRTFTSPPTNKLIMSRSGILFARSRLAKWRATDKLR